MLTLASPAAILAASLALGASTFAIQPPATTPDTSPRPPAQTPDSEPPILNELDALSRRNDDPFGTLEITKIRKPISVTLRALDKIIARTTDIEIPMNEIANFGTLEIVPRFCDKRPPEDFPETTAFLEVFDKRAVSPATPDTDLPATPPVILAEPVIGPQTQGQRIFTGWMFASSPGLNALEHPVYDVWVIDCKTQLVEKSVE